MRAYVRTSRRTGVSMPWWLAMIVGALWLVVMLMVLVYGWILMGCVLGVRATRRWWARRQERG